MKYLIAVSVLTLPALFSPIPALAQAVLDSGQSYTITPPQTECLEIEVQDPEKGGLVPDFASAQCDTATGIADVKATDIQSLYTVDAVASSVFQYQFRIEDVGGAIGPSQVPIHIRVPVDYVAYLYNNHLFEAEDNAIQLLEGIASLDIILQLRQDPDPDAATGGLRGTVIEKTSILSAENAGIGNCFTIPTDGPGVISGTFSCLLALFQSLEGSAQASLSAVIEVGRTYNLELLVTARAHSDANLALTGATASTRSTFSPDGLRWNQMVVTVGTDPAMLVADLQKQIDELREALKSHTHTYLTGKGVGHNNTVAVSSAAIIPGAEGGTGISMLPGPGTGPGKSNPARGWKKFLGGSAQ
jgi:hypothetical protein